MVIFAVLMLIGVIFLIYILPAYLHSGDNVKCNTPSELKTDAKIVNVSHDRVGLKGHYKIKTTVTFDDGFVFEAHDTTTEKHIFHYTISVSWDMNNEIIKRAISAHSNALRERGISVPSKPFVCGKCGNSEPYEGNCPNCGSSIKRYL